MLLRPVQERPARPFDERQILFGTSLILIVLQHHRGQVHAREHVAEPRRQTFLLLQITAQRQHRNVDGERERSAEAVDVLVEALRRAGVRHARETRERERHHQRARSIAHRETDVPEQGCVELPETASLVLVARGVHLAQHERMAANGALTEDDQAARQYVGAFDGDRHRHQLIAAAEVISGPKADALAAVHVHCVVRDETAVLRKVVLQHRRRHGRLFTAVDGAGGDGTRRIHDVGVAGHARERFGDAFEMADRTY